MIYELSQQFFFDAAHTLERKIEADGSRRIHGHTYHAEVTVSGMPDAATGMVMDIGALSGHVQTIRGALDHRLLNEIEGLGAPTLENLCGYIAGKLGAQCGGVSRVKVWRSGSGDACTLIVSG
jgi:6-pyruvoyltetrahydropterin/6-carboxytetrahydropterin synthase